MKDNAEICRLTRFGTLKHGSIIYTNVSKTIQSYSIFFFFFFFQFCDILKNGQTLIFHLSYFQIVGGWQYFTVVRKLNNIFKSLHSLRGCSLKLDTFVWILNHVSRSITWSLFNLKESNLVKRSISTLSFMWWCQFIDYLKFKTRPSSLHNSEMSDK